MFLKSIILSLSTFMVAHSVSAAQPEAKKATAVEITKENLLNKCTIPEKRAFELNPKINPCDDFHAYVCDKEEKAFKLPKDRSSWTFSFNDHRERLLFAKKQYLKLIEKGAKAKTEAGAQIAQTYRACMDEKDSKTFKKDEVLARIKKVQNFKTRDEWKAFYDENLFTNDYSLVSWDSLTNLDKPETLDVMLMDDLLFLPEKRYYSKADAVKDYQAILVEFFKALKFKDADKRARSVLDFEKNMADHSLESNAIRKRFSIPNSVTRADLQKKYPNLSFATLLAKVPEKTAIRDIVPETLTALNDNWDKTSTDTLLNHYLFHSLISYTDDVYPEFFKKYFKFANKHLGGPEKRPDRQERCTNLVMGRFPFEFDYELIGVLFPDFPKQKVVDLAEKVRGSLLSTLQDNKWLTTDAKKMAIEKMKSAKLFLVVPDRKEDWNFRIPKTYSATNAVENEKVFAQARIEQNIKELSEVRNRQRWEMGPLITNAYYMPPDNIFVLTQAILQPPFFDANGEEVSNLAAIGTVVGHELGHGIDDEGSKFDSQGRLKQWMNGEDLKKLEERTSAFIEQFNKAGHDGKLTLGENIGDHVGLRASYRAAFPDAKNVKVEDQKKFFIGYAKAWCGVMTPSARELRLKTDPHSLGEARINQQVVHLDGFYSAFQCKPENKLYIAPEARIQVW